ncbi:MAG: S-layer homology domain-containing protein [Oscillospiraceae bacterium]|nr:S-layer homology domain-containing protein [Oscillospiraceae bacterium]
MNNTLRNCLASALTAAMAMLLCAGLSVSAAAADTLSFAFDLNVGGENAVSVTAGEAILVSVTLRRTDADEGFSVFALQDEIVYDVGFFETVKADDVVTGVAETGLVQYFGAPMIKVSCMGQTFADAETVISSFYMRPKANLPEGASTTVYALSAKVIDEAQTTAAATTKPLTVTVGETPKPTCSVTYQLLGGTMDPTAFPEVDAALEEDEVPVYAVPVLKNSTVTLPPAAAKEGHTFVGWSDGEKTYAPGARYFVTQDATICAVWKENEPAGGGNGGGTGGGNGGSSTGGGTGGVSGGSAPGQDAAADAIHVSVQDATLTAEAELTPDGAVTVRVADAAGEAETAVNGGVRLSVSGVRAGQVLAVVDETGAVTRYITKSLVEDGTAYALLTGSCTVRVVDNARRFDDVGSGIWYKDAADFVSSHELFFGVNDTRFAPDVRMTRGMLVTVLHRLESLPKSTAANVFSDVAEGQWYTEAVTWAHESGIVKGYDTGDFGVADDVTREQLAAILYRYAKPLGVDDAERALEGYADAGDVSFWAEDAMRWAVGNGLIRGDDSNRLNPGGYATRAETATILMRVVARMVR